MTTIEYRCSDGTPFDVRFDTPEDAATSWRTDLEHSRDPRTPMGEALDRLGVPGAARAYADVGMPMPGTWRPGPDAHGFAYYPETPMPAEDYATMAEASRALVLRHGSAEAIWREFCLPKAVDAAAFLDAADHTVPFAALAEVQAYGQQMTMVAALVNGNDLDLLTRACRDACGDDAAIVAYELTQGFPNETLRADQALWELGQAAQASVGLRAALDADDPRAAMAAARAGGADAAWFGALDAFLAEFGGRAEAWDIAAPTWNEQAAGFWHQLRAMRGEGVTAPRDASASAARRRDALAADVAARFGGDAEARARFERRLARAESYVDVREHRAHWQLVLVGSLRHALLRRGSRLVERGVVDAPDDILYLTPDEAGLAMAAGDGGTRALVRQRRTEHEFWRARTPPPVIGGGTAPPSTADAADDVIVRGRGASRGRATGVARVVRDLADADRVAPGDVLVCVTTTPPWTPLFAIVAALVVDSGDMTSHSAIAAREYGIPCVLATRDATARIADGAAVTVDGDVGTVHVLARTADAATSGDGAGGH